MHTHGSVFVNLVVGFADVCDVADDHQGLRPTPVQADMRRAAQHRERTEMTSTTQRASKGTTRFWDRIAQKYARSPISDEASYREKLSRTQALLNADSRVLEIACGTGTTALHHAEFAGHILATDISGPMIEIAQAKAVAQGVANVTFQRMGIDDLTLEEGSLDMVMAHSILHLLEAPEVAIARAFRWLKPGGVFVTSTICLRDALPIFRAIAPVMHGLRIFPYVTSLRSEELKALMTGAGFELETVWQPSRKKALFIVARKPVIA